MAAMPFVSPKLKLDRAEKHLEELVEVVGSYLAAKPCVIVVEEFKGAPAYLEAHSWNARIRVPVPIAFSAIIGDVVHNLRTALDLLACDLVELNNRSTKGVYFPFCAEEIELDEAIRSKNMHRAGEDVVELVRALKPYKGGNALLRALHDMDIADKHKALIPTVAGVSIPEFSMRFGMQSNPIPSFSTMIAFDGQMVVGAPMLSNLPLGSEIHCDLLLVFDKGDPLQGLEVVDTLGRLKAMVSGIIQMFEDHCRGPKT